MQKILRLKRVLVLGLAAASVAMLMVSCASKPEVQPEPEVKPTPPSPPPKFEMKDFHRQMGEEMLKSYEKADEILLCTYTGGHMDELYGLTYYFDDFISFDKTTLSWGPRMQVIVQVLPHELKPELITRQEFKSLSELDKVGICWDDYDQERYYYLIEGEKMLIFLQQDFDEENTRSFRNLIDTYPATKNCNSKAVFDLMVRHLVTNK
jgi:hypothetical protein